MIHSVVSRRALFLFLALSGGILVTALIVVSLGMAATVLIDLPPIPHREIGR